MGAVKANNNKDTYKATAVAFIVIGTLFLINKLLPFASIGLPWVMNKDNLLLYASISFLIFKRDKSVGFVLLGLWLVMNIGLVMLKIRPLCFSVPEIWQLIWRKRFTGKDSVSCRCTAERKNRLVR